MRLRLKIIVGILLSVPIGFFLWLLVLNQWNEFVVYGNIEKSVLLSSKNLELRGTEAEFGGRTRYSLKVIESEKFKDRFFISNLEDSDFGLRNKTIEEFKSNLKEGDTLLIKIMNKQNAKILKWKNLQVNKSIDYWNKAGTILLILSFTFFILYVYYRAYKMIFSKI